MEAALLAVLDKAWVVIGSVFAYMYKEQNSKITTLTSKVNELEKENTLAKATYITEARMREVISEVLKPYADANEEIKSLLKGVDEHLQKLSRDVAVESALRDKRPSR